MFWKSALVASGAMAALFACETCNAQSVQPSPPASPACNTLCQLFTALKGGSPNAQPASQTPPPAATPASAATPKVAIRKARAPAHHVVEGFRLYATGRVADLQDLQGQSVSLGLNGSRTQARARKVLARAGITVHDVPLDADNAFDALGLGAVKAIAVSGAHEYALMDRIPARYGVHRVILSAHVARRATTRTASLSGVRAR